MNHNELMRNLRRALAVNEHGLAEIYALSGESMDPEGLKNRLKQSNESGYVECEEATAARMLEALIIHLRGAREGAEPPQPQLPLSNTHSLKKLRIAYDLKDEDMHRRIATEGKELGKQQLKSLFRKPDNKNYLPCSDKLLRVFLKGLVNEARAKLEADSNQSAP